MAEGVFVAWKGRHGRAAGSLALGGLLLLCGCNWKNSVVRPLDPRIPKFSGADGGLGKSSSDELLGPESGLFCPQGFLFSTQSRICVNDREAVGPFSNDMIASCIAKGQKKDMCEGARWPVELARELRGSTVCQPGATLERRLGACAAGQDVFGPFRLDLVVSCKANGGGLAACETMRWHRMFLEPSPGAGQPSPPSSGGSGTEPQAGSSAGGEFDFPEPSAGARERRLSLWATFYKLPEVDHREDGIPLRNARGEPLGAKVARADWCDAAMEGSVRLRNGPLAGKTLNYAATTAEHAVDCSAYFNHPESGQVKFRTAQGPYGDGVLDFLLVPLRSIAVDPRTIPYGSVVYVPSARGAEVQVGGRSMKHDGYFFAADTGGLIRGNHIDVYAGPRNQAPFSFIKSRESGTFEAFVINDSTIIRALRAKHLE